MASTLAHLSTRCQELMTMSNSSRVNYIYEDKWVNHSIAADIRSRISSSLFLPHNDQGLCMMVVGVGGAGK